MEQEWKLKRARAGGGALIDPGIHLVDLALHLAGASDVGNVTLRRRFWDSDVEDNCAVSLVAAGEVDIAIEVSLTAWKNFFSLEAYGSDAQAILHGRGGNYGSQQLEYVNRWFWNGSDQRYINDFGVEDLSFEKETRAFLKLVADGEHDGILSSHADGLAALSIVQSAYNKSGFANP